jgi:hypothetical protein
MEKLIWKPVPGYEKVYQVSNDGRVRSRERVTLFKRGTTMVRKKIAAKILKPTVNADGYHVAELWEEGERERVYLHILVLRAFVGEAPDGAVGRHIDGDLSNNRLDNLAWD